MINRTKLVYVALTLCLIATLVFFGSHWFYNKTSEQSSTTERTLAIIKPDAVRTHSTGKIIDKIENEGFTIIDLRKVHLEREQAEKFYAEHQGKKFFHQLVDFMTSGPVVAMILEKNNAIPDWRMLMGATDPAQAKEGTIRKEFAADMTKNAVHGSDSKQAAHREIRFFFADRIRN